MGGQKREIKVRPPLEHDKCVVKTLRKQEGRNRAWGEGDEEVNFGQDKCEVSLLCLGHFQSFGADRVKTKERF